jgi:tetratricopeptide (TPR) repeat protein
MLKIATLALLALLPMEPAMAIDLAPLWDFDNPQLSEQRLRAALATAAGDDALILQTQIARSYGLRGGFATARQVLADIEPATRAAGAEARVRYALELGRTYASATHPPGSQTPQARAQARAAFQSALDQAKQAKLDDLAIDAIHMFAFVDTEPADQLAWGRAALTVADSSVQPAARRWQASIRNNIGYALHQLARYDEALVEFERALAIRESEDDAGATRVARWMVAWTLRALGRTDEALAIQLRLERENQAAGQPDPYVFEELALLYRAKGDLALADRYAAKSMPAR